jgi:hypothetical protein
MVETCWRGFREETWWRRFREEAWWRQTYLAVHLGRIVLLPEDIKQLFVSQFVSWIYIRFATSIDIFPWETRLHFLEKCGQLLHISMQLSWEHLLHFSNAFIKGIIGQIASNVVLGEVKPFFNIFIHYAISLKSFPWRSKPSSFFTFLSKVGSTSLKFHPFHNFYIHFPNERW